MGRDPEMSGIQAERMVQMDQFTEKHIHAGIGGKIVFDADQEIGITFADQAQIPLLELEPLSEFRFGSEIAIEPFAGKQGEIRAVSRLHALVVTLAVSECLGRKIAHQRGMKNDFMNAQRAEFAEIPVHRRECVIDIFPGDIPETVLVERSVDTERNAFTGEFFDDLNGSGIMQLNSEFPAEFTRMIAAAVQFAAPVRIVKCRRSEMYLHDLSRSL